MADSKRIAGLLGPASASSTFFMILEAILFVVGVIMTFKAYSGSAASHGTEP